MSDFSGGFMPITPPGGGLPTFPPIGGGDTNPINPNTMVDVFPTKAALLAAYPNLDVSSTSWTNPDWVRVVRDEDNDNQVTEYTVMEYGTIKLLELTKVGLLDIQPLRGTFASGILAPNGRYFTTSYVYNATNAATTVIKVVDTATLTTSYVTISDSALSIVGYTIVGSKLFFMSSTTRTMITFVDINTLQPGTISVSNGTWNTHLAVYENKLVVSNTSSVIAVIDTLTLSATVLQPSFGLVALRALAMYNNKLFISGSISSTSIYVLDIDTLNSYTIAMPASRLWQYSALAGDKLFIGDTGVTVVIDITTDTIAYQSAVDNSSSAPQYGANGILFLEGWALIVPMSSTGQAVLRLLIFDIRTMSYTYDTNVAGTTATALIIQLPGGIILTGSSASANTLRAIDMRSYLSAIGAGGTAPAIDSYVSTITMPVSAYWLWSIHSVLVDIANNEFIIATTALSANNNNAYVVCIDLTSFTVKRAFMQTLPSLVVNISNSFALHLCIGNDGSLLVFFNYVSAQTNNNATAVLKLT